VTVVVVVVPSGPTVVVLEYENQQIGITKSGLDLVNSIVSFFVKLVFVLAKDSLVNANVKTIHNININFFIIKIFKGFHFSSSLEKISLSEHLKVLCEAFSN